MKVSYKSIQFLTLILSYTSLVSAWSPTDSYAPGPIDCPSDLQLTRSADGLSQSELSWLQGRDKITNQNLISFLKQVNMTDFDPEEYITNTASNETIRIGIAFSGGGYRAMLSGAGQLSALDNRTTNATEAGLGGLLQASTYLVGLSGGNWLVGTIAMNNFTDVQTILDEGILWDLTHSIANFGGINIFKTYDYYSSIDDDINDKENAGFKISFTDVWGRALSHQFFAGLNDTGAALTWSTLQESPVFQNFEMPFPIVVTDGRTPGSTIISGNSTIFEVNPFELGSWDPSLYQFTQVKYLGTNTTDGKPVDGKCIGGFDNAGFIMGTSSSLFNQFILQINTTSLSSAIKDIVSDILEKASEHEVDIAIYEPNPFYDTEIGSTSITNNDTLFLCDGGEDLQNIPLQPLIHPEREVDVIFAFDNSADTDQSWPNGTSIVATFERQFLPIGNGTLFPYVPDEESLRNLNLTAKPTFFGCDIQNLTSLLNSSLATSKGDIYDTPLVVYTANRPFSFWSNESTFKLSYEDWERDGMIQNGFEVASRLNNTLDPEWPACVGCAIIRRSQERLGIDQSEQCQQCFQRYCWNGQIDDSQIPPLNFTETGLTDGAEESGNRTISASSTLLSKENKFSLYQIMGIGIITFAVFAINL
ncbi:phospholipase B [Scheffersomyces amazonensis]|uniref:phospholipase B n=1 Tax=Scheffersomyces amazonensis TaxID=1078765 RepID=UPI00315D6143